MTSAFSKAFVFTAHTIKYDRFCFQMPVSPLWTAFSNVCVFDENDQRFDHFIIVDDRQKALVWTGPQTSVFLVAFTAVTWVVTQRFLTMVTHTNSGNHVMSYDTKWRSWKFKPQMADILTIFHLNNISNKLTTIFSNSGGFL